MKRHTTTILFIVIGRWKVALGYDSSPQLGIIPSAYTVEDEKVKP